MYAVVVETCILKTDMIAMVMQGTEAPMWRYIDPDGQVQGPFNSNEMHTWFESNYLQMELPICGMVSCTPHQFLYSIPFIGCNRAGSTLKHDILTDAWMMACFCFAIKLCIYYGCF